MVFGEVTKPGEYGDGDGLGNNNFKDESGNWHYTDSMGQTHDGTNFNGNSGVGASHTGNATMDLLNG